MTAFSFITKKPLWVNILTALGLTLLLIFIFLQLLGLITRHGEYMTVPSVVRKNTKEAVSFLEKKGFEVVIVDSVYVDSLPKGIVIKQLPDPNSTVKVNRTVFLTVNRETLPMVDMPALEGKTMGFALEIMKRSHLVLGDTVFKPDFMKGSVLEQQYKGVRIAPLQKLPWGSRITLVVGSGLNDSKMQTPNLLGLTFEEAKIILEENGLAIGALVLDPVIRDTASAYIYRQDPPTLNEERLPVFISSGQLMDLWLSKERLVIPDSSRFNQ